MNNEFDIIKYKVQLLEEELKPGFFRKWFGRIDKFVESKIGEDNPVSYPWETWEDIEKAIFFNSCDQDIKKCCEQTYNKYKQICNMKFMRESASICFGKKDKDIESLFLQLCDLFNQYIEATYVCIHSTDDTIKIMAKEFCDNFINVLSLYECTIYKLVVKRLKIDTFPNCLKALIDENI